MQLIWYKEVCRCISDNYILNAYNWPYETKHTVAQDWQCLTPHASLRGVELHYHLHFASLEPPGPIYELVCQMSLINRLDVHS